ncbi:alpha/beta hydrolase family protein [Algibacillus agarilyticus]|uniref:alpha/beta hydrolase family protein n=1 Tax=Algibacillus agarilyticus TaxID=2234133 RepID=UPI000DCF8961|nr:alpha/beta fold hydrolase [Algibacillus agarilyticus]
MKKYLFILLALFSAQGFTASTQTSVLPLENYGALPNTAMMRVSPNMQRIAYRASSADKDLVVVYNMQEKKTLGAFDISQINPNHMYFISDDKLILVASEYKKLHGYRGKHDVSSAFVYDIKEKELRQLLTPGYGIYRGQTGLGSIVGLSPDKRYAYMPAYVGKDGTNPSYDLLRVDLTKKREPRRFKKGNSDVVDWFVDNQGNTLARERYNNKENRHTVEAWRNDEWHKIFFEETEYRNKSFVGVTPDRQSLVMLGYSNKTDNSAYFTMSLKDGTISEPIFGREDASVAQVFTDINRVVKGVRYSGFKPSYGFFDKKLDKTIKAIQAAMPNNSIKIVDHDESWSSLVFYLEGEGSSGDFILYKDGSFSFLASARKSITPDFVNPVIEYTYKARDGLAIPTLLTYPAKLVKKDNLPAILMPHGGPASYDRYGFNWKAQYFASRGYLVIQPQFRGSSGFGSTHLEKGHGEWGGKMQDDLTDAITHLSAKGKIDPKKVCIVGSSYGGYAALAGAAFTPELYKCVVSVNGVSDVKEMLKTEKRDHGSDHWVVAYWENNIAEGQDSDEFLESISPINFAEKIQAPVLLIHGEDDSIVPYSQSDDMFDELEDFDKDVTLIELEDEGHHLRSYTTRLQALKEIDKFVTKHMNN